MTLPTSEPRDKFPYEKDPESKPCSSSLAPGDYVYVQDADGIVWVAPNGPHQHPKVLGGGQAAAAAGELIIGAAGKVEEVNNLSGTFGFGPETLDEVVGTLQNLGFEVPAEAVKRYPKGLF